MGMPDPILYRKSDLCIPRNETVWPRSQFPTFASVRFINSLDLSAYLAAAKYADRSWDYTV